MSQQEINTTTEQIVGALGTTLIGDITPDISEIDSEEDIRVEAHNFWLQDKSRSADENWRLATEKLKKTRKGQSIPDEILCILQNKHPDVYWKNDIQWGPVITWDDLEHKLTLSLWAAISRVVPWYIVWDNLKKPWSWLSFSARDDLDWDLVRKYPDEKWNYSQMCKNNNWSRESPYSSVRELDWDLVRKYPDMDWCWNSLSLRDDLDFNLVRKYPRKKWNLSVLMCNPIMTQEFITEIMTTSFLNCFRPVDSVSIYKSLSKNKNLTVDFMLRRENLHSGMHLWDWNELNKNENLKQFIDLLVSYTKNPYSHRQYNETRARVSQQERRIREALSKIHVYIHNTPYTRQVEDAISCGLGQSLTKSGLLH
jgi:hypothetical protein